MATHQGTSIRSRGHSSPIAVQDGRHCFEASAPTSKADEDAVQQALRPLYDKACVLALAVAQNEMTEHRGWALLYLTPSSRVILDRLCSPGCRAMSRAANCQQPRHKRECSCSAAFYLKVNWIREIRRWSETRLAMQHALRRRLAPALEARATAVDVKAICRAADPCHILTELEQDTIMMEERAWWTRCHTQLTDVRSHAA